MPSPQQSATHCPACRNAGHAYDIHCAACCARLIATTAGNPQAEATLRHVIARQRGHPNARRSSQAFCPTDQAPSNEPGASL
jgi:hypothetical protein